MVEDLGVVGPGDEVLVLGDAAGSRVIGSYFVRPRPLRMTALPPSLYSITSEERLIDPTLLTAATGVVLWPKYTRNR